MKFILEIDMDSAAFDEPSFEVMAILKNVANCVYYKGWTGIIQDSNGNACGNFKLSEDMEVR